MRPSLARETELLEAGADIVIGFDEVGRGALAGPVMVGAAALARSAGPVAAIPDFPLGLADSKLLSPRQRAELREPLDRWLTAWAVGSASNQEIDSWGIAHALGLAALRALALVESELGALFESAQGPVLAPGELAAGPVSGRCLPVRPHPAAGPTWSLAGILDGPSDYISRTVGSLDAPTVVTVPRIVTQVKADQSCATVAAASVLAKLTRDALMEELAAQPQYAPYAWAANKGYGSQAHREAIRAQGPSDLHRLSWHLM